VVFPGGVGPRELVLVAALAPVMPRGAALATALVSRVVLTASDLAWGGAGLAVGRRARGLSAESVSQTLPGARRGRHGKHARARTGTPLALDAQTVEPTASLSS
jgi:hypothetical protein